MVEAKTDDAAVSKGVPHRPIIVIVGPTASGKSALALRLAQQFGGEIVGADSRHVYRGLDVGTGKETVDERASVKHHMVDVVDPDAPWSLAIYQRLARAAIENVRARGAIPLVVGGTGLYIQSVTDGLLIPEVAPQPDLRKSMHDQVDHEGPNVLFDELTKRDPEAARFIDGRNVRRVIRALEVIEMTGQPFSSFRRKVPLLPPPLVIGISAMRQLLHQYADRRIETMFAGGFVEEVARLEARYDFALPAFSAVGYREVMAFVRGNMSLNETKERVKRATHQYQRRQLTWFRRTEGVAWLDADAVDIATHAERLVCDFLRR